MQINKSYSLQKQDLRKENNNNVNFQANTKTAKTFDADAFFKDSKFQESKKKSNTLKYLGYAALGAVGVAALAYFHKPTGDFFKGIYYKGKSFFVKSAEVKEVKLVLTKTEGEVEKVLAPNVKKAPQPQEFFQANTPNPDSKGMTPPITVFKDPSRIEKYNPPVKAPTPQAENVAKKVESQVMTPRSSVTKHIDGQALVPPPQATDVAKKVEPQVTKAPITVTKQGFEISSQQQAEEAAKNAVKQQAVEELAQKAAKKVAEDEANAANALIDENFSKII